MSLTALHALFHIAAVAAVFFLAGRFYESRRQRKHLVQAKRQWRETLLHRAQADVDAPETHERSVSVR